MPTHPTASREESLHACRDSPPVLGLVFIHPPLEPLFSSPESASTLVARSVMPVFPLAEGLTRFGRSSSAAVRFTEDRSSTTSGKHAELRRSGDRYFVRDLGSRHGTYVNGQRLGGDERPLEAGDLVRMGDWVGVLGRAGAEGDRSYIDLGGGLLAGPTLARALAPLDGFAKTRAPVVLEGETGTGKDLVARLLHRQSGRSGDYVARNCAAFAENLADGEIFGWKRGAFTGAERDRDGCFQLARGGTLLLDEVDLLSASLQAKLLRAVQSGEIVRLGSGKTEVVDVRVVAATQRALSAERAQGSFRPDLYYRLATHVVRLPPLRERREEIPFLLARFLATGGRCFKRPPTAEFVERLCLDAWPGNVRELESFAARVCAAGSTALGVRDFETCRHAEPERSPAVSSSRFDDPPSASSAALDGRRDAILAVAQSGGNLARLARELGLSKDTLYRFLHRTAPGWRSERELSRRASVSRRASEGGP